MSRAMRALYKIRNTQKRDYYSVIKHVFALKRIRLKRTT